MKNFKKYLLIVACATSNAAFVFAADIHEATEQEIKESGKFTVPSDKDKQIVPVAPTVTTEQNQIVKIEEQKQASKPEVKKEENFDDLLKFTTSQKANFLIKKLKTIKKETNKEDQEKNLKTLAYWIKDEWKNKEKNNLSEDLFYNVDDTLAETYFSFIPEDDAVDEIYTEIYKIADIYEPYILKQLFPELEKELNDINLSERHFSKTEIKNNKTSFFSIDLYFDISEKDCLKVAENCCKNFKTLEFQNQFLILACWLTMEWYYKLS